MPSPGHVHDCVYLVGRCPCCLREIEPQRRLHRDCAGCGPTPHHWYEESTRFRDLMLRSEAEAWVWMAWFCAAADALAAVDTEALAA